MHHATQLARELPGLTRRLYLASSSRTPSIPEAQQGNRTQRLRRITAFKVPKHGPVMGPRSKADTSCGSRYLQRGELLLTTPSRRPFYRPPGNPVLVGSYTFGRVQSGIPTHRYGGPAVKSWFRIAISRRSTALTAYTAPATSVQLTPNIESNRIHEQFLHHTSPSAKVLSSTPVA